MRMLMPYLCFSGSGHVRLPLSTQKMYYMQLFMVRSCKFRSVNASRPSCCSRCTSASRRSGTTLSDSASCTSPLGLCAGCSGKKSMFQRAMIVQVAVDAVSVSAISATSSIVVENHHRQFSKNLHLNQNPKANSQFLTTLSIYFSISKSKKKEGVVGLWGCGVSPIQSEKKKS